MNLWITYYGMVSHKGVRLVVQLGLVAIFSVGLLLVLMAPVILAAENPGDLDSTFGTGGIVTTHFFENGVPDSLSTAYGEDIVIQSDGKIVVAGWMDITLGNLSAIALARYNTDGSLDETFGQSGLVQEVIGEGTGAQGVVLQNDGRIVIVGSSDIPTSLGIQPVLTLLRYDGTGKLDESFGSGGIVTTTIGYSAFGEDLVIQSDGKIVVAGASYGASYRDFFYPDAVR